MTEQRTYQGSCHCGAVRYEAKSPPIEQAMSCNCSMCRRKGSLLAFIPATDFTLQSGGELLTDYQFNKHVLHHLFCRSCGVTSFVRGAKPDGTAMIALNVRCIDDIDPDKIKVMHFDGKNV